MTQVPLVRPQLARQRASGAEPWMAAPLRYAIAVLALTATCVAGYLTYTTFGQGTVLACSGSNVVGCDDVLGSVWSRFLGMPVSLAGVVCYAAIFVLSLVAGRRSGDAAPWINTALATVAMLAVGAGLWFTSLQLFEVGKLCLFCLAVHACGLAIIGLVLCSAVGRRQGQSATPRAAMPGMPNVGAGGQSGVTYRLAGPSFAVASVGAVVALVVLIGGQVFFPPKTSAISMVALDDPIELTSAANSNVDDTASLSPDAQQHVVHRIPTDGQPPAAEDVEANVGASDDTSDGGEDAADDPAVANSTPPDPSPARKREITLLDGKLKIDLYAEAVLGSREAPQVVVELLDYTCSHCRKIHENIKLARNRYGDQLVIVILPVPLELECNKGIRKTDPAHRGACRLARLALAVAEIDLIAFADFHNWLMANEKNVPRYSGAVVKAHRMVDRTKLRELTKSKEINDRIVSYVNLFSKLTGQRRSREESLGLPIQIVGDAVLSGKFESPEAMFEAWEEQLDLQPE